MTPEFEKFSKIPRLNRDIIITEKIDGTNAQVLVTEDGEVFAGSRNRWLTPEADNFGFAAWVAEHEDELRKLGPGRHFGEWWGQGIQRKYGLDHKRFSLFNVRRWVGYEGHDCGLAPEFVAARTLAPGCCHVVPILYMGPWDNDSAILQWGEDPRVVDTTLCQLESGSWAAPGFKKPEGIVIYHTAARQLFKVTLENDEQPKGVRPHGQRGRRGRKYRERAEEANSG